MPFKKGKIKEGAKSPEKCLTNFQRYFKRSGTFISKCIILFCFSPGLGVIVTLNVFSIRNVLELALWCERYANKVGLFGAHSRESVQ